MSEMENLNDHDVDSENQYSVQVTIDPPDVFVPCDYVDNLEGPFYKTQYVADKVGVDRQTVINYANLFEDVLAIRRKPSGDREYTEESIRQIAFLINDKKTSGRTLTQEADYIKSRYGKQDFSLAAGGVRALEQFFDEMKDALLNEQKSMFEELLSSNKLLIEKQNQADEKILVRLDEQAERYEKVIESQQDEIIALKKQLDEKNAMLTEEKEKNEKKGLFGWLKR